MEVFVRLLPLFLLILSLPVAAQVYKWTDEDGNVHFGDKPRGTDSQEVKIRDSSPGVPVSTSPGVNDLQRRLDRMEREREQRASDRRYEQAQRDIESGPDYVCQGAKNRLSNWQERWEAKRRQGYAISEQDYYEQRIREAERHRDNVCR